MRHKETLAALAGGIDERQLAPYRVEIADGLLFYLPDWLAVPATIQAYDDLSSELAWSQDQVFVYGKWHSIPRLQAWYGDSDTAYQYSGKTLVPHPWSPTLASLRKQIESLGIATNSVLANWYRDGNDKMGWHSDNERELGDTPVIASLSLGAARDFQLKHKVSGQRLDLELKSGSLLIMAGTLQNYWQHALPQRKRVKSGRINLTFRQVTQHR